MHSENKVFSLLGNVNLSVSLFTNKKNRAISRVTQLVLLLLTEKVLIKVSQNYLSF